MSGGGFWLSVETGYSHTCGIQSDHRLYCWVRGCMEDSPCALLLFCEQAAHSESLLTSPGDLHVAGQGSNTYGQVGDGTTSMRTTPSLVSYEGWWLQAATGDYHTCGIRSDFSAWCWVRPCMPLFAGPLAAALSGEGCGASHFLTLHTVTGLLPGIQ